MSQEELMRFFDQQKGRYFSVRQLQIIFADKIKRAVLFRDVKKIIRREDYIARLKMDADKGKLIAYYGAKR